MKRLICFFLSLFFLFFFSTRKIEANLINNFSFEEGDSYWQKTNSNVSFLIISDEVFFGSHSAFLTNSSSYSYGIERVITDIDPFKTYQLIGYVKIPSSQTQKALIRVAWYKSNDGSGSQFSTNDASASASISDWQKVELIKEPPSSEIRSAKIRLLVAGGSAYFDEIYFDEYVAPTTIPILTPTQTFFPTPTVPQTPTPISYSSIYLSEVMVNPSSGEKEWVELYNNNDFEVFLGSWYIDDIENAGATPKKFFLTMGPRSYAVIEFSSAIFNNDGDQVRLLDFNKMEKDSFEYSQSLAGKSWGRIDFNSDSWCLQEPTKNQSNGSCLTDSANDSNKGAVNLVFSPTPTKNILTKTTNFIQSKTTKKMTAKKIENPVLKVDNRSLFLQKGEVLGEKTEMNNEKTKKIFVLPFFYSLAGAILSLKKILEQLPA
jgi:hypothetical protein